MLHLAAYSSPTGDRISEWSHRATDTIARSGPHGFEALETFVEMSMEEAFALYERSGLPHVVLSDAGAGVIWEGRLEDVALVPGGIRATALGYWRAGMDVLYSALWSHTDPGDYDKVTDLDRTNYDDTLYKMDNRARLYIEPTPGEAYTHQESGGWSFAAPHGGRNNITRVAFHYDLTLVDSTIPWTAVLIGCDWDFQNPAVLWTTAVAGTGDQSWSDPTGYARIIFALYANRTPATVYDAPWEAVALTTRVAADHNAALWTIAGTRFTTVVGNAYDDTTKVGHQYDVASGDADLAEVRFSYELKASFESSGWRAQLVYEDEDAEQRTAWSETGKSEDGEAVVLADEVSVKVDRARKVWLEFYFDDEDGLVETIENEEIVADHNVAVSLAHMDLISGSVSVEGALNGTIYTVTTDYTVDHTNGTITALSTGSIPDGYPLLVTYRHTEKEIADDTIQAVHDTYVALTHGNLKAGSVQVRGVDGTAYAGEVPVTLVTDELIEAVHDTPVELDNEALAAVTEVRGHTGTVYAVTTDYTVDLTNGTITALSTGSIPNLAPLYVTYTHHEKTVSGEIVQAVHDTWVPLAKQNVIDESVSVTALIGTSYDLTDDYEIDEAGGQIKVLSTGTIANGQYLVVGYTYTTALTADYEVDLVDGEIRALSTGTIPSGAYLYVDYIFFLNGYPAGAGETYFEYADFEVKALLEAGETYLEITDLRASAAALVTADEIVSDIASAVVVNGGLVNDTHLIDASPFDLADVVYEDERAGDVLSDLALVGDSSGNLMEVGVWEGRILHYRTLGSASNTYYVDIIDLEVERTLEALYNSVYGVYADEAGRTLRTAVAEDAASEERYGLTRQDYTESRATSLANSQTQADTYLAAASEITPRVSLTFTVLYTADGTRIPLYRLRASDVLVIRNLPPDSSDLLDRLRALRVVATEYRVDEDTIRVDLELLLPSLGNLVAGIYA